MNVIGISPAITIPTNHLGRQSPRKGQAKDAATRSTQATLKWLRPLGARRLEYAGAAPDPARQPPVECWACSEGTSSGAGPPPAYLSLTCTTSSPGAWSLVFGFAVGRGPVGFRLRWRITPNRTPPAGAVFGDIYPHFRLV